MSRSLLSVCLLSLIAASLTAEPIIEIPDNEFYFGKTVQQATVRHVFWIKSVGTDTLRITEIRPGCGCTEAPLKDSVLAPGDSTELEIIFSTKRFRGLTEKKTAILSNAANEAKSWVTFISDLSQESEEMRPLVVNPMRVDVSQFTKTPRRRAKFLIENRSDEDFGLSIIDSYDLNFTIELPKKIKAGETVEATVIVNENEINEEFTQSFTFQLDDQNKTRYSVPVKRTVRIPGN